MPVAAQKFRSIFLLIALVVLPTMMVNPSQIVWAQAQTQQHSDHLKYDVPVKNGPIFPPCAEGNWINFKVN